MASIFSAFVLVSLTSTTFGNAFHFFLRSARMASISQLDRLPDELLIEILKYAMIRDTPFDLGDCMQNATQVQSCVKRAYEVRNQNLNQSRVKRAYELRNRTINQTLDDDSCFQMSPEEMETRWNKLTDDDSCFQMSPEETEKWWSKMTIDMSSHIHQDHLRDWRIAGSVCKRIRRLGKEAFFSSKIIPMDIPLATKLQGHGLSRLSLEDQQTAIKYINSIVLIDYLTAASPWIKLPRCIAGFPKLRCLDFRFGDAMLGSPVKERVQAPSHFHKVLTDIGVPTENLARGIMIVSYHTWSESERKLKILVYPGLNNWAKMKLAMGTKRKRTDST